jgi:hypothetical protein
MENLNLYKELIEPLEITSHELARLLTKKATMGFDGCVDSVVRVVKQQRENETLYFESSQEFANYILGKGSKNFSIELNEVASKIGGNMPIMASALSTLGAQVNCVGALGYPKVHKVFSLMPMSCELHSFANPGSCIAFEFRENKMMTAEMQELNEMTWNVVETILGRETLISLFSNRDLIAILNWSEINSSTDMWKGLLNYILPNVKSHFNKPIGFFDLSDCSKRSKENIREALELLRAFHKFFHVILSMNVNEAILVNAVLSEALDIQDSTDSDYIFKVGESIYRHAGVDKVVIHYAKGAFCWDTSGVHFAPSSFISEPAILTGAGDNFNAGFCAGLLMSLTTQKSLLLGHAVSQHYLRTCFSPTPEQLGINVLVK